LELGQRVKAKIRDTVGSTLRCSIGLAPNRYLSKVASDMEKPDGLVALTPDILETALMRLTPRDLPGVGPRMEARLHQAGIRTMQQLWALDRDGMNQLWGGMGGDKLWHWLRGEDFDDEELEHAKSIGNSHVLAPELRTPEGAYAVVSKLLHKTAMRLRTANLWASNLRLSAKFAVPKDVSARQHNSGIPQLAWSQSLSLVECQDNQTLTEGLKKLWAKMPTGRNYSKPFYVGVTLNNLVPDHLHTLDLFAGQDAAVRRTNLSKTMDSINKKHGTTMLFYASMLPAGTAAPTRIAFTSIPDLF
ncbi:MAG: DNA polymerase, partial [Acidobacteriaceae bacterium]